MYGTLRGALAGRKVAFDRESYTATVEGRIIGIGKTIRIKSIHMKYELAVPAESREATERALTLHPEGCPAHQSVQGAIEV
ncbi:MAG TPA: OsmC family protein, partial [Methylomirabilota bacterium]|nr:OsmC family protein [Methylomirabilota bacterium]